MVDFKKIDRHLKKVEKGQLKQSKKDIELQELFVQAMEYSSTDEVDLSIFTPEKILELAAWAVEHGTEIAVLTSVNAAFLKKLSNSRQVRRAFGCM